MIINLHIERLVLEGLPISAREGASVEAAMQAELTRLFARDVISQVSYTGKRIPILRGELVSAEAKGNSSQFSLALAQSVYGAITNETASPRTR